MNAVLLDVDRSRADGFATVRGSFSPSEVAETAAESDRLFLRRSLPTLTISAAAGRTMRRP